MLVLGFVMQVLTAISCVINVPIVSRPFFLSDYLKLLVCMCCVNDVVIMIWFDFTLVFFQVHLVV